MNRLPDINMKILAVLTFCLTLILQSTTGWGREILLEVIFYSARLVSKELIT